MRRFFTILFFVVISTTAFSQQLCQAYFTSSYNPANGTLNLYDQSYNFDSTQINVNTWNWTFYYGGATYTYSGQNPVIPIVGFSGTVYVCLTIYTSSFIPCQSSYCDSIDLSNFPPPINCIADFTSQIDTVTHNITFTDMSFANVGNINSWTWVISLNGTPQFTSILQNPVYNYQADGLYNVCLYTSSDSGCTTHHCISLYVPDSGYINNCQLTINANVSHVSVINGSDGTIDLTVAGGTPPYTYVWNTGATTQDIYNLSPGVYTVAISSTPACPSYTYSFAILQPFDSNNVIVDTLYSPVIDTCLNFVIDSFYIAGITVQGNSVTVEWIFIGGGATAILYTTYTYSFFGSQVIILSVSCGSKNITQYTSYIYLSQAYSVAENANSQEANLYPNPVSDILNITFGSKTSNSISLKIFSTTGQQVYEKSVSGSTSQVGINVCNLPSGVYFIQIDAGIGKPIVKKFLK
jgi:hypothetical protein